MREATVHVYLQGHLPPLRERKGERTNRKYLNSLQTGGATRSGARRALAMHGGRTCCKKELEKRNRYGHMAARGRHQRGVIRQRRCSVYIAATPSWLASRSLPGWPTYVMGGAPRRSLARRLERRLVQRSSEHGAHTACCSRSLRRIVTLDFSSPHGR